MTTQRDFIFLAWGIIIGIAACTVLDCIVLPKLDDRQVAKMKEQIHQQEILETQAPLPVCYGPSLAEE